MLPDWQPQEQLNLYRLSDGAEHYEGDEGYFEVRFNGGTERFQNIVGAFKFYITIQAEAELWDDKKMIERKRLLKMS